VCGKLNRLYDNYYGQAQWII